MNPVQYYQPIPSIEQQDHPLDNILGLHTASESLEADQTSSPTVSWIETRFEVLYFSHLFGGHRLNIK